MTTLKKFVNSVSENRIKYTNFASPLRAFSLAATQTYYTMSNYPKIGIRPIIDARQGGIRESLEDKTMNLAKAVADLIRNNLRYPDGSPVECVIADLALIHLGRCRRLVECSSRWSPYQ